MMKPRTVSADDMLDASWKDLWNHLSLFAEMLYNLSNRVDSLEKQLLQNQVMQGVDNLITKIKEEPRNDK